MPVEFACPSCGAPHEVDNPGVVMSVCEYCGNAVVWDEGAVENVGKQATLSEGFTRLYRGALGSLFRKRFHVLGRARYSFGSGFWDEWFIEYEDRATAWVTEDNHEIAVQRPVEGAQVPPFESCQVGSTLSVAGAHYLVHEVGRAKCLGIEGSLPRLVRADDEFPYVDGSSWDGQHALGIEYRQTPPLVFSGRWVRHDALVLDDEGGGR